MAPPGGGGGVTHHMTGYPPVFPPPPPKKKKKKKRVERVCFSDIGVVFSFFIAFRVKGLSHLTDLARRSNTGAQICRFSGIGTGTAAQRYQIGKNGSTPAGHRQIIGDKISNGGRR